MKIKSLKFIIITQNALGIGRNWSVAKLNDQNWKILFSTAFWIVSSSFVVFAIESYIPYYEKVLDGSIIRTATLIIVANTLLTMVWAYCTSAHFEKLLFYLTKSHKHLKRYTEYIQKETNLHLCVGTILLLFIVFAVVASIIGTIAQFTINITEIHFEIFYINLMYLAAQLRMGTEYLLFFYILKWTSLQLEFIAVDAKEMAKRLRDTTADELKNYEEYEKSLDNLFFIYMNTCESCSLINKIFSAPISASLGLTLLAHLALSYGMATYTLTQGATLRQMLLYALTLTPTILSVVAMALAGQGVHNGADSVVRALAHLLQVTNVSDEVLYHSVRRAVRAAAGRPLRVKIFGSIEMGTSLLPTSLAFFTSYLVIALQFNNVL